MAQMIARAPRGDASDSGCARGPDAGSWRPLQRKYPEMSDQTPEELALAHLLIDSLNLEDLSAPDIDPEAPLFGEGLGLDSIDALELALAISKQYGFQMRSDGDQNRQIFASLRALSAHIQQHKTV